MQIQENREPFRVLLRSCAGASSPSCLLNLVAPKGLPPALPPRSCHPHRLHWPNGDSLPVRRFPKYRPLRPSGSPPWKSEVRSPPTEPRQGIFSLEPAMESVHSLPLKASAWWKHPAVSFPFYSGVTPPRDPNLPFFPTLHLISSEPSKVCGPMETGLGPFAAVFPPGHTSPPATKYKETILD